MHKHAFIFDMDGVIVDSNPYHKIAIRQFCEKHGLHLSEDDLRNKVYGRTNKAWLTQLFGVLPPEKLAALGNEKEELYRTLYAADIKPVKGLISFLEKMAAAGIPRAIGTSAPAANVEFTLSRTGTTGFFPIILDESFVTHGKPDPEIYLKVAAALNLPASQCIVIEDSLSGIDAGKAAGSKVIGITTTHSAGEMGHTDLIIDDFEGLNPLEMIEKLFQGN